MPQCGQCFTTTPDYFVSVFDAVNTILPSYKYLFDIPTLQKKRKKKIYFKNKNFYFKMRAKILSEKLFLSEKTDNYLNFRKLSSIIKFFAILLIL